MSSTSKEKYGVLLVDDSVDDRWFMRRALRDHPKLVVVAELSDGDEAIAYLSGRDGFADRQEHPFPDVVLLDLKMPRRTGYEVLEWLRAQSFGELVVIVVSGSSLPADIARSRELGAAGYYTKSAPIEDQELMVRKIEDCLFLPEARAS